MTRSHDILRKHFDSSPDRLRDICDGSAVTDAVEEMRANMRKVSGSRDSVNVGGGIPICLSVSFDGMQIHRHRVHEYWPLLVTILNLPPHERIKLGVGTFIIALMSGSSRAAEEMVLTQLFVQELRLLVQGLAIEIEHDEQKYEECLCARIRYGGFAKSPLCSWPWLKGG